MRYFPINVDLNKFRIVVIGGGRVATRKVQNLIEFSAKPVVISPKVTDELQKIIISETLEYVPRKYQTGDLSGFDMVFVATDDEALNNEIITEIGSKAFLVNFADQPEKCNFIMPSFIKRGDLLISISTQGRVPFLSRFIRECLEKKFPENFEDFVNLSIQFRSLLYEKNIENKQEIINEYLSVDWMKTINSEGFEYAFELIQNLIRKYERK